MHSLWWLQSPQIITCNSFLDTLAHAIISTLELVPRFIFLVQARPFICKQNKCIQFRHDVEHPMDITMSRVRLASDTCDIYLTNPKVNHLIYTCSLDPFEDGILLDTPLVCMHKYCWNTMDDEGECKRQGKTTPSAREA